MREYCRGWSETKLIQKKKERDFCCFVCFFVYVEDAFSFGFVVGRFLDGTLGRTLVLRRGDGHDLCVLGLLLGRRGRTGGAGAVGRTFFRRLQFQFGVDDGRLLIETKERVRFSFLLFGLFGWWWWRSSTHFDVDVGAVVADAAADAVAAELLGRRFGEQRLVERRQPIGQTGTRAGVALGRRRRRVGRRRCRRRRRQFRLLADGARLFVGTAMRRDHSIKNAPID